MNPKILIDDKEVEVIEEDPEETLEKLLNDSISWFTPFGSWLIFRIFVVMLSQF